MSESDSVFIQQVSVIAQTLVLIAQEFPGLYARKLLI